MENDPADEAARFLRLSIPFTDFEKQRALDVLCKEIDRLRALFGDKRAKE